MYERQLSDGSESSSGRAQAAVGVFRGGYRPRLGALCGGPSAWTHLVSVTQPPLGVCVGVCRWVCLGTSGLYRGPYLGVGSAQLCGSV